MAASGSNVVRELFIAFGFAVDDAKLKKADSAIQRLKLHAEQAQRGFGNMRSGFMGLTSLGFGLAKAIGLGAGGAAGAMFGLAKSFADAADEIDEASQRTGIASLRLQALQAAARLGGSSAEDLEVGIKKLSTTMADAKAGNKTAVAAFKELGVKATDARGKLRPVDEVMLDISDAFQRMPNGARKADLAVTAFGRSGTKMIPMLNGGRRGIEDMTAELVKTGAAFTEADKAAGDEFDRTMGMLGLTLQGLKISIGRELLPIVIDVIKQFRAWVETNREWIKLKAREVIEKLAEILPKLWQWVKDTTEEVQKFIEKMGGFEGIVDKAKMVLEAIVAIKLAQILLGVGQLVTSLISAVGLVASLSGGLALLAALAVAIPITLFIVNWDEIKALPGEIWDLFEDVIPGMLSREQKPSVGDVRASAQRAQGRANAITFGDLPTTSTGRPSAGNTSTINAPTTVNVNVTSPAGGTSTEQAQNIGREVRKASVQALREAMVNH